MKIRLFNVLCKYKLCSASGDKIQDTLYLQHIFIYNIQLDFKFYSQ
jgi:hypothetical protein